MQESLVIKNLNYDFGYSLKETEFFDLLLMVSPSEGNIEHQFKIIISFENKPSEELVTTVVNLI